MMCPLRRFIVAITTFESLDGMDYVSAQGKMTILNRINGVQSAWSERVYVDFE